MRVLVVGAGAVGGYFGARLAGAGRDVTFLVRAGRAAQLRRDGLKVVTREASRTIQPKIVMAADLTASFDLVLLSVKAYALAAAMDDFAAVVGPETMILPLLNGMAHVDALAERFGARAVLGGSTQISTDMAEDGSIHRLTPLQDFVYGELDGSVTERIKTVKATVSGAGFDDELSTDIVGFMWQKWVVLSALASITCLFSNTIGAVASVHHGLDLENALLEESAAIAAAEGHPASAEFLKVARGRLTNPASSLTASMFRDVQRNAPVEVEHVIGDLLRRGEAHGLSSPLLRAAYVQLSLYEVARKSSEEA